MKSWSIRKGPSLDPAEKRLAVVTEDHPVEYLKFEGHIPEGNYGAGEHMIWDEGTYEPLPKSDPLAQLKAGRLKFRLNGEKLRGEFNLIRLGHRENQWLLIKGKDEYAQPGWKLDLLAPAPEGQTTIATTAKSKKKPAREHVKSTVTTMQGEKAVPLSRAMKAKELSGDLRVKAGPAVVSLTHLDKIYWPGDGYTKGDLVRYYYEISKYILPYLKDRPLIMKRYPNGITGPAFHQHDAEEAPSYVRTFGIDVEEGHRVDYIIGDNLATLLYMTNLGAIERHPWHSRTRNLDHPDWFVFDLDPGKGVEFPTICEAAMTVREVLGHFDLECYAKTSGSRGIHVYVPIKPEYGYDAVADFAAQVAAMVTEEMPQAATVERSLKNRKRGQIYIDHMQNARGKSVVAPYSVRPKPGAPVSAPLEWPEVQRKRFRIEDFNIHNMLKRLARKGDIFKQVLANRQSLRGALRKAASRQSNVA